MVFVRASLASERPRAVEIQVFRHCDDKEGESDSQQRNAGLRGSSLEAPRKPNSRDEEDLNLGQTSLDGFGGHLVDGEQH